LNGKRDLLETDGMNNVLWTASSGIRVKRLDYIPTLVAMSMIPVYGQAVNYRQRVVAAAVVSDTLDYNEIYINRLGMR
jgi:hypothetical protein